MVNLTATADYLAHCVQKLGFILMSEINGNGLPLVAFRLDPKNNYNFDEFAVAHQLRERGWIVPAYTMAPKSEKLKLMRIVVREDFSRPKAESLLKDLYLAMQTLSKMAGKDIQTYLDHAKDTKLSLSGHTNNHYADEKHSLQGKDGKTHAVC